LISSDPRPAAGDHIAVPAGRTVARRAPAADWLGATLHVGWILFRRENPLRPVVVTSQLRIMAECLLFTLLGVVIGGSAGGDYSFVGAVVLASTYYTVAMISDVPMRDRMDGTYPQLSRAGRPPFLTFVVRGLPVVGAGAVAALVAGIIVGAGTGRLDVLVAMAPGAPLLLAACVSGGAVGLFVIAPAIGTRYDALTYNTMTTLIVVFSGALIPTGSHDVLDAVGGALPLHHAIAGIRAAMEGKPWGAQLLAELAVAAGWALVAAFTYQVMDRRGRTTGRGAFSS
jgi:hypothetical protein